MEEVHIETNTESQRKLASIQIVDRIDPHNNANALELATVLGWQIVTRLGEAKVGQLVVYCEIDSVLPDADWLPPAIKQRITESSKDTFRLKTVQLRKEISQGLIVPLVECMPFDVSQITEEDIGRDVTEILGIKKYEPPALSGAYIQGAPRIKTFPSHIISKTDETRIQSCPKMMKQLDGKPYYSTVKCDGTSGTFFIGPKSLVDNVIKNESDENDENDENDESDDEPGTEDASDVLVVCSRNQIRPRPNNTDKDPYWIVAEKYKLFEKLLTTPHLAIQGEVCGPDIQGNLLGLKEIELFVFNVVDLREPRGRKLEYSEMVRVVKKLGLTMAPIEEVKDKFEYTTVKELLEKADAKYPKSKKPREGLVFRSQDQQISFKVINNKYLLKTGQ